jgi:hypothetical protein
VGRLRAAGVRGSCRRSGKIMPALNYLLSATGIARILRLKTIEFPGGATSWP